MEFVEGPEGEALRARTARFLDRHRPELDQRRPVLALRAPALEPRALAASDTNQVTLCYGDVLSQDGPLVTVRTARVRRLGVAESSVGDALDDEHDRLFDHAGIDESRIPAVATTAQMLIDGAAVPAELHREGFLWAARVTLAARLHPGEREDGQVVVTVVGRGVPADHVQLAAVADLGPYWDGREALLAVLTAQHVDSRPEDLELPTSSGLEAHRALVEARIRDSENAVRRLQTGQRPNASRRGRRGEYLRLWEAAVRAQTHLSDQGREVANDSITSLVNHLTSLAIQAAWFARRELRAAAIEETLGHVVFGAPVPSLPAQQAWRRLREAQRSAVTGLGDDLDPDIPLRAETADRLRHDAEALQRLHDQWLRAWTDWTHGAESN